MQRKLYRRKVTFLIFYIRRLRKEQSVRIEFSVIKLRFNI